jgi:hypothetical protein
VLDYDGQGCFSTNDDKAICSTERTADKAICSTESGKDGVPYPVAREVYDKSIKYLSSAIEGAEIERIDRIQALKKLVQYSARIFNTHDSQR